jgi:hypothetical protein
MTDDIFKIDDVVLLALEGDQQRQEQRAAMFDEFWRRVTAADERLGQLRDKAEWREEIEGRLHAWRATIGRKGWDREWSRPEIVALADRVRALDAEVVDIWNDVRALSGVANGSVVDDQLGALFLSLTAALDALAPAAKAARAIAELPEKRGGRGAYTENLRSKPVEEFGRAMISLFRAAGIPLGGNASRDPAFDAFIEIAHSHVEGSPVPGKAALLASLRKF